MMLENNTLYKTVRQCYSGSKKFKNCISDIDKY